MGKELLTAAEVAKRLRISLRTFEGMVAKDDCPPFCRIGRLRRWEAKSVDTWIDKRFDMELGRKGEEKRGNSG